MTAPVDSGLIGAVGLTMSDLHVLHVVATAGGQTRYCVDPAVCKPESLARVNTCVRKGLLEHQPEGDGSRWVVLRLTDLGRRAHEQQKAMLINAERAAAPPAQG